MRIHWVLFGLLLAMCGVVGYLLLLEETPFEEVASEDGRVEKVYLGHGFAHTEFPSMNAGGPGEARHENILLPGLAYGVLTLLIMVAFLAFGIRRDEKLGALLWPLVAGAAVWSGILAMIVLSYRSYMTEESHSLFLSLPKPTAWFVYGFWPFQAFFVAVYVVTFKRVMVTDSDLARFQEILAAKALRDGEKS